MTDQKKNDRRVYVFGDFVLDRERGTLQRKGQDQKLRPQSFAVLCVLVERAGTLVTKEDLLESVWRGASVTDDSITQCLIEVRRVLGDTDRVLIKTVPRRGYLFTDQARESDPSEAHSGISKRRPALVAFGSVVSLIALILYFGVDRGGNRPPPNSVAVLPFENLSDPAQDQQTGFLGAFSDELRDQLGRVPGLRLAARSSSRVTTEDNLDAVALSDRLGVAHLVEGSFRRQGDNLRIAVQLIEGASGLTLWSQVYERRPSEIVAIQQSIAEEIVAKLLPDADAAVAGVATLNPSANEFLLLARYYEEQVREEEEVNRPLLEESIRLYRKATDADPNSALAFSRLAGALLYNGDPIGAEAPMFRALSLNPDLSEVQETLGKYYWARQIDEAAGVAWERAVELNPNNADALASYAYLLWMQGYARAADEHYRRALQLDPLSIARYGALGHFLGNVGKVEEVRALIEEIQQLFKGPTSFRIIGDLHERLGEIDHAIAWTIRARNSEPEEAAHVWRLAELYAVIGEEEIALSLEEQPGIATLFWLQRYEELVDTAEDLMIDHPDDVTIRYWLAFAYNAVGQYNDAVRILESTGIPEVLIGWPTGAEWEAGTVYLNALIGRGEMPRARALAHKITDRHLLLESDWWIYVVHGCTDAVMERYDKVRNGFEQLKRSVGLPWLPLLQDSKCFEPLMDEPLFKEVLDRIDRRRAELRMRLPETLAEYGVTL